MWPHVVVHTDFNCLTVLQYAVEVLKVKHVIVVGHYGCGGIAAAYEDQTTAWRTTGCAISRMYITATGRASSVLDDEEERLDLLCELNVKTQVAHVCHTTIAQRAWARGQKLAVHGWVYSLRDGLLKDLDCTVDRVEQIPDAYRVTS